jgi:hypothetical protein
VFFKADVETSARSFLQLSAVTAMKKLIGWCLITFGLMVSAARGSNNEVVRVLELSEQSQGLFPSGLRRAKRRIILL